MTTYKASKIATSFHKDDNFVRLIMGPLGSGKSVACCCEIFRRACLQVPTTENIRQSRWVIIRNTYTELRDTTLRTWFEWFPPELGYWNQQQMRHHIKLDPGDGKIVDLEVLFRALDKPQDIRKLLSLELTGAWINEAREVPKAVLDMLMGRVGRFPSRRHVNEYWHGVIMDTNPCDSDHWIYRYFEEIQPDTWKMFRQPSGLSDKAENRTNLPMSYYEQMMPGKTQEWINVYVHGKYGFVSDGKPIYPEFNDDIHVSREILQPVADSTLYVGLDFGLTPAATISQVVNGQWQVIDEVTTDNMGTLNFGDLLGKKLRKDYPNYTIEIYGDPAGSQRAQTDEQTPFMILASLGIQAMPASTNDFDIRREAVAKKLTQLTFTGGPQLLISPKARLLRKAMGGGYKFKRVQMTGEERYHDKPDKNQYSHVAESLQYALVGAGEGYEILGYKDDWDTSINVVTVN